MIVGRKSLAASAVALALLAGSLLVFRPTPPRYKGKPLREWLQALPNNFPPGQTNEAEEAVRRMGSDAVPFLLRMLRAKDSVLTQKVKAQLDYYPWLLRFYDHDWQDRIDALKGVIVLGPAASATVPEVTRAIAEGFKPDLGSIALERIGPAAVPALLQLLALTNKFTRASAAGSLTHFPNEAAQIVPTLERCLDDPDPYFRAEVAQDLRFFIPPAKTTIPKLLRLAGPGCHPEVRQPVVQTLHALDPEGVLNRFLEVLEAPDPMLRANAAENLRWLGHDGASAVPALLGHLRDPDKTVQRSAAVALGEIAEQPDLVVPALIGTLHEEDWQLRICSAWGLSNFGNRALGAVPVIQALLAEPVTNEFYKIRLREVLERFKRATLPVAPP